jgi:hypothetical protein
VVSIANGNIYVSLEVYETYFRSVEAVALLADDAGILILPLIESSAGGILMKMKNLRGDRVIHAQEFIRRHGYLESNENYTYSIQWSTERAGLLIQNVNIAESRQL